MPYRLCRARFFVAYGQAFCENALSLRVLAALLVDDAHHGLRKFEYAVPRVLPSEKRCGFLRRGEHAIRGLSFVEQAEVRHGFLYEQAASVARELVA